MKNLLFHLSPSVFRMGILKNARTRLQRFVFNERVCCLAVGLSMITLGSPHAVASEPTDPTKHYIGINPWFLSDGSGENSFVDIVKHARSWQNYAWNAPAVCDADGWPNQDCSTVIFGNDNELGAYTLKFNGQASVAMMWISGSIGSKTYDSITNTTTATVTLSSTFAGAGGLKFLGTKKTAASGSNTGIANVRLYRPGYPTDGSVVFTTRFLNIINKFHVVRFMDWQRTNTNPLVTWAQRRAPFQADKGTVTINAHGGQVGNAIEDYIRLCNDANADLWINIPVFADNDYITKMAQLIRYGGNASGIPYTTTVTSPVYPPLNSGLKVYLEYGNEIWNPGAGFYCQQWIKQQSDPLLGIPFDHPIDFDGESDQWTLLARYSAWKTVEISKIFRSVFGDSAMMTRIRPTLMGQLGGWLNPRELQWLESFYSTFRPATDPFPNTNPVAVSHHIYCAGGSAYYRPINSGTADPNIFLSGTNYPDPNFAKNSGIDALRATNYGLKRIAYEGGMDLPTTFTVAQRSTLNADPRMQDVTEVYHDEFIRTGGDLLVYYCATGPSSWEFTPDIDVTNTPKLLAVDNLRDNLPKVAVNIGTLAPGTSVIKAQAAQGWPTDTKGTFFDITVGGQLCAGGVDAGEWYALPIRSTSATQYGLSVRLAAASGTIGMRVKINGLVTGTVSATTVGTGTLVNSGTLQVTLKEGLNAVRIEPVNGMSYQHSITLTDLGPTPIPGTTALFSESFNSGIQNPPWTTMLTTGTANMTINGSASGMTIGNINSQSNTNGATAYIKRTHNVAAAGKPALLGYFDIDFSGLSFVPGTLGGQGSMKLFEHWLSSGNCPTMKLSLLYSGYSDIYRFAVQDGIQYFSGPNIVQDVPISTLQTTTPRLRFYYDTLYTPGANLAWTLNTTWTVVNLDSGTTLYTWNPSYTGTASNSSWNPLTDTAQTFNYGVINHSTWTGGSLTGQLIWSQIYSGAGN